MTSSTSRPTVSVITPVFNSESFILDTIDSVVNQSYTNWELILIDDCSTDSSVELIRGIQRKDHRIKLIKLPLNSGAATARNSGINSAQGRYITFLDADDLWAKEKLVEQLNFSSAKRAAFVYSSYMFADSNGSPISKPVPVPSRINYEKSLRNHIIWTSTVMIDTEVINKNLILMPNLRRGQDAATWWKILRETGLDAHGISQPLALYRRTNLSLSANKLKAAKRTWHLFSRVEQLGTIRSVYYFIWYALNATRKRL